MRTFFTLLGTGVLALIAYTYGAKAGRGRYREIQATIEAVWNDPRIRKARKQALKRANNAATSAAKQAKKIGR
jgi:hypothetical protein